MADKEWTPANVLDVFGDAVSRDILVTASTDAISAATLAKELDVSPPTVYRRIEVLTDYCLLSERRRIKKDGHNYRVFETNFRRVAFELADGEFTVEIELREDLSESFESFWSDLEQASSDVGLDFSTPVEQPGNSNESV